MAPIDPGAQQQANDRLDAAVVDGCFVKLDAVVSDYEAIRSPTEEQTASAAGAFARTLNGQCGMKDRVEADPRYQAILRRLAPLSARMTVLVQRKCHAIKKEVTCFDTCVEGKDLFAWDPCRNKCISRPRDGVGIAWVIEELKTELRSLGCK